MAITAEMPMMIPRAVRKERSLLARMASSATRKISVKSMEILPCLLAAAPWPAAGGSSPAGTSRAAAALLLAAAEHAAAGPLAHAVGELGLLLLQLRDGDEVDLGAGLETADHLGGIPVGQAQQDELRLGTAGSLDEDDARPHV